MAVSSESEVVKKLAALQLVFKQQLPGKIEAMDQLWRKLSADAANNTARDELHRMAHSLAGSGGTFGAIAVSAVARELEQALKFLLKEKNTQSFFSSVIQQQINEIIAQLKQVADTWQPSSVPYIESKGQDDRCSGNLIYLAEDDELLAASMITKLEQAEYQVKHFTELSAFEKACEQHAPAAIIMDVVFKEGDVAGANIIQRLKDKLLPCPPVIFSSVRDDMVARLAASRAGASRYFCKPLDMHKLIQTLDGLTAKVETMPYRILLIDDDETLLEYYATVLIDEGMEVSTLSDPMQGLEALHKFNPDVVVMDVYMPNCTGPELAQVIRQDDSCAMMPIMFLSTEADLSRQLVAMNLGGDDFLVKPVEASHLASSVAARAKRARWTRRLNMDLDNALRESRFQLATMDLHDIVSSADVTGRIISVNDKFCEISGYSREELLGKNHRIIKSAYHSDAFYADMWHTISHGKVWNGTLCNKKKNGELYWVNSTIVPFLDAKGRPYKYVSARTDITALRESEQRLELGQIHANIGTWDWNIQNNNVYWSDRAKKLYGYTEELKEISFEHFINASHPDDREAVKNAITNCLGQGVKYDIEHRVIWPDGSVRWVLERGDVIRSKKGELLNMLGVVQDITERKQVELALQENQEKLSSLYELSPLGIALTDMNGAYVEFNEAFRAICGYPKEELSNLDYWTLTPPEYKDQEALQLESLVSTGRYGPYEKAYRQKNGELIPVRLNGMLVKNATGEQQIWSIVEDITENKLAEQALLTAKEEAEHANHAKSQFLSNMSHELRTPMNAIIGFGQIMQMNSDESLSESQLDNVHEILKGGHHLLELINDVLDLARIEEGRIDLSIETVVLSEVLNESLQMIMPLAQKRGIEISLLRNNVSIDIEDLKQHDYAVRADRVRLKQVLLNLLSNAIKYNSDEGKIIIDCELKGNQQLRIGITDTGAGLSVEQQAKLFTAFDRLGAEQAGIEGTGIGLVITRNIVELMGGKIVVESQVGEGSTFWIELPNDKLPAAVKDISVEPGSVQAQSVTQFEQKHTVLYIEDNPANLRLVTQVLSRRPNIHMWSAHEPMLGLELAAEHTPDLILLDINLPGMDGFEVFKRLRQRQATQNTPVIAISANAMPKDIERGLQAGFDDYITKPIDVSALLQAVDLRLTKKHE